MYVCALVRQVDGYSVPQWQFEVLIVQDPADQTNRRLVVAYERGITGCNCWYKKV
jgi:hypothetical protein